MAILKLTGKVKDVLAIREGDGRNGHWSQQQFTLDISTINNGTMYQKEVVFDVWNGKVAIPQKNSNVVVNFDISSRRSQNGNYFTSCNVIKIEPVANVQTAEIQAQQPVSQVAPQGPAVQQEQSAPTGDDDLPF